MNVAPQCERWKTKNKKQNKTKWRCHKKQITSISVSYKHSVKDGRCSNQLGFASLIGTFHISPHENILTIALINIHYLYIIFPSFYLLFTLSLFYLPSYILLTLFFSTFAYSSLSFHPPCIHVSHSCNAMPPFLVDFHFCTGGK